MRGGDAGPTARAEHTVREATFADADEVARLMTSLGYPTTPEEMRTRLANIAAAADYVSLVAERSQAVVGFLGLAFAWYYERNGCYARIVALSVAPEARGTGVGSSLVRAAETIAKQKGALACIVNSGVQRVDAHRFYEKQGFTARGKAFYKPLTPA